MSMQTKLKYGNTNTFFIQYNEIPLRVEYSLTEKGRDLLPVFYAISQWGMKYIT